MISANRLKKYAKGVVAVGAFLAVLGGELANGSLDPNELYAAGIMLLGALGVIAVPNKK